MSESSRRSVSPLLKSRFPKVFLNEIEKVNDVEEDPIDRSEETLEIAAQLALIRKRHDKTKESNNKKRIYYEKLKLDIENTTNSVTQADYDTRSLQLKIEELRGALDQSKKRHDFEQMNKRSYLHVLERMKQDKLAMEIKANTLQLSLKSTRNALTAETDNFRKVRENQFQSKVVLQEIKHALAFDQKRKNERITQLEKNIKERQEMAMRREERQKRQVEISEAAGNDDKDSQEAKIRENLLSNRMWYVFLRKKLEVEIMKGVNLEQAFHKIRGATGVSDANDIVERFLTKETSHANLIQAVNQAEKKLESLKHYNSDVRDRLNKAQFDEGGNNRKLYSDIEGMESKLTECYKEHALIKEKLQKSIITYDEVLNWGQKMFQTLEINQSLDISPGSRLMDSRNTLEEMFEIIYNKLLEITNPLQNKKEETQQALESFAKRKTGDIVNEISSNDEMTKYGRFRAEISSDTEKISDSKSLIRDNYMHV